MQEILDLLKHTSPFVFGFVATAYFLKYVIEKKLEAVVGRVEEVAKTSLEVKKELRGEERSELVAFRVAVERWEDFLLTSLFDYSMLSAEDAQTSALYAKDKALFLEVKVAIVRACIYLRDKALERELTGAVIRLRKTYYPFINQSLPVLIDIQARLFPIQQKLDKFRDSNFQDMSFAPTEIDRSEHLRLQTLMTEEVGKFSESLLKVYPVIAEQMVSLKEGMNAYVYRPIEKAGIDKA